MTKGGSYAIGTSTTLESNKSLDEMNRAYRAAMGNHLPARTVIGVAELPKPGVLLTMNLTAVTRDAG